MTMLEGLRLALWGVRVMTIIPIVGVVEEGMPRRLRNRDIIPRLSKDIISRSTVHHLLSRDTIRVIRVDGRRLKVQAVWAV